MRETIKYKMPYRVDGEEESIDITISFISNRVINEYSKIINIASDVTDKWDRISDINSIMASSEDEEKIEELRIELNEIIKEISSYNNNDFFDKRFDILKRILIDNGYKNNDMLMSFEFWDTQVDPDNMITFMTQAVYKDVDKKKVVR